jgi:chorismate mutase
MGSSDGPGPERSGTTVAVMALRMALCRARCNDFRLALTGLNGEQSVGYCGVVWTMDERLARYRRSIDNIDAALIAMLAERFKVTQAVGELKAELALPPADDQREAAQVERLRKLADDAGLDPEFSEKFLRFIIDEVIRHHTRLQPGQD